jgi:hypothetical protein
VNWEAYSHEELYRMLWQDADVADVSVVATEWAQYRAALDTHAEVLREQRVALLDGWRGSAAEEAADRLDALAGRVEKISELAYAGQRAAQEAADALATARAMMPPPPAEPVAPIDGDPATRVQSAFGTSGFAAALAQSMPTIPTTATFPAAPAIPTFSTAQTIPMAPNFPTAPNFFTGSTIPSWSTASLPSIPNYAGIFGTAPTSGMGTAFGAVGSAGFSFYFGAASVDQQKAEAIRAMRTYESSLVGGSRLIDQARGAIPPATPVLRADVPAGTGGGMPLGTTGGTSAGTRGGVPWSRLLGGGPLAAMNQAIGAPTTGHGVSLGPGPRAGVLAGMTAGVLGMPTTHHGTETSARTGANGGVMAPVGGGRTGNDDEPHENRMPTVDHGLFTVDLPVSPAVIGLTTGAQL